VKATGLLLWDAAPALAAVLEANPPLLKDKRVLELGCGAIALCSLIASNSAATVFATDGDPATMSLLQENMELNSSSFPVKKVSCRTLEWGKNHNIEDIKSEIEDSGFDLIVGTDVTYVAAAVPLLFQTARSLIANQTTSMLMLCHYARKVAETDILATAAAHGFAYFDVWKSNSLDSLVVPENLEDLASGNGPLRLLCFQPSEQGK
jgi:methyltransferase-like protein 6